MEGLYTAIVDEFPRLKKHALATRIVISGLPFLTCLPTVTYGGIYVVQVSPLSISNSSFT